MAADFTIGLDLGSSLIKTVVLSHKGKTPKLVSFGSMLTPTPGMNSEADIDLEGTAKQVRALLTQVKAPDVGVTVALPESKIFTRVITDLPFLSDEELVSAIRYSAEEFVPLPADQINLYWQIINRSKQQNSTQVFVVASPKNTINKYLKVLEYAKLRPIALETELIASTRALIGNNTFVPTTMLIQFGATSTDFAIVSKGIILFTRSIAIGGMIFTRSIAQYLNFEMPQAEEYKKVYGLLEDQLEGKIYQILKPLADIIISEAARVIQAFQSKNSQNPIKRIVLTGGGAKMPGLVVYFANNLGLEVQEADPWFFIEKDPAMLNGQGSYSSKLLAESPNFTVAVGLALREE